MAKREGRGRRWLLRLLGAVVCLILALVGWSTLERRGMNAKLAALRQAGQPALPEDLNTPRIADAENAVVELRAAAEIVDRSSEVWKKADEFYPFLLPFREDELAAIRAAVDANAKAFPLVEAAVRKPGVDWAIQLKSPMIDILLPDLNKQRGLVRLLGADALLAHQAGDDATAIQRVAEMRVIARALDRQPFVVSHLVAAGTDALACEVLQQIAPDLRVGDDPKSASEAQVRDLIRQLSDDTAAKPGLVRALQTERVSIGDSLASLAEGRLAPGTVQANLRFLGYLKPLAYRNGSGAIEHMNAMIGVVEQTNDWPSFRDQFDKTSTPVKHSPRLYFIAGMFAPSMERVVMQHYRITATRRMTAVALAVRLHTLRDSGAMPKDLEALVPEFLPAVPTDPLATGGKPLRYINDPTRPRVYSLGENGVDDGGTPIDPTKYGSRSRDIDDVVDMVRQPKPAPEPPETDEVDGESGEVPEPY